MHTHDKVDDAEREREQPVAAQAVPFAVNLDTGALVWIDSSNGSTAAHQSATDDTSIGSIEYDELARPRMTFGDLARLWAQAHNA
ncbi:hypothetical protein [Cellulomonas sp. P5_C5]